MSNKLTDTICKIKTTATALFASVAMMSAENVPAEENAKTENQSRLTETVAVKKESSKPVVLSDLKIFMNAFFKYNHADRSLLIKTKSDLNTLQKCISSEDFGLLFDKTKNVVKLLSGTEEEKVNTMRILYRIASTKNGLDFLKKCDVNMPFRLETKIPLKSDDFSDFKNPNCDLKDGVITVKIGNMSPLPLTRYTMLAAAKLMEKKPVEKEEQKNKKTNNNRMRYRFNYMDRR